MENLERGTPAVQWWTKMETWLPSPSLVTALRGQFPVTFVLSVWSVLFWNCSCSSQKTSAWVRVMSKWTGMNYYFHMKIKSTKHNSAASPYPFCSSRSRICSAICTNRVQKEAHLFHLLSLPVPYSCWLNTHYQTSQACPRMKSRVRGFSIQMDPCFRLDSESPWRVTAFHSETQTTQTSCACAPAAQSPPPHPSRSWWPASP